MQTELFDLQPFTTADKVLCIKGPDELTLFVDFDDVPTDVVEEQVDHLVDVLNGHWGGWKVDWDKHNARWEEEAEHGG